MRGIARLGVLLLLAGCATARYGGPATGTTSAEGAVRQFVEAAKAQDLQGMSAVWGDSAGATRDRADRAEMEQRLIILACHLRHDGSQVGSGQPGTGGRILFRVDLTQGEKRASPIFTTVRNLRSGRWYVEVFELDRLRGWCSGLNQPPPASGGR